MTKAESKYFNTALLMDEALISLLKVKNLEYITVKELCQKAGVNRSTFYLHYDTMDDLLKEAMEMVNRRFSSYFGNREGFAENIGTTDLRELILIRKEYLLPYLNFIRDNKAIYRASFKNPEGMEAMKRYGNMKKYIIEPILKRFSLPERHWKYYISYYIEGMAAIIKQWLEEDCREPVETIAAIILRCIRPPEADEINRLTKE